MKALRLLLTRIASAVERIADHVDDSERIEQLERLLAEYVELMTDPRSVDEDWTKLLEESREVLKT